MKLTDVLAGTVNNHIFPFMWIHGETEEVYRDTVQAIAAANIGGFCIEARPHPNFCREQWWHDLGIILDEAEKRGMKVWILDDKHFPTGYANGAVEKAPNELRRQSILYREYRVTAGTNVSFQLQEACRRESNPLQKLTDQYCGNLTPRNTFHDDRFLGAVAICEEADILSGKYKARVDLADQIQEDTLTWQVPAEGNWTSGAKTKSKTFSLNEILEGRSF